MNYGEILKRAWDTIWKHKILWLFGLLASCTANSGGGGGGGGGSNTNYSYSNGDFAQQNPFNFNFEKELNNLPFLNQSGWEENIGLIVLIGISIFCLILILSLLFTALGSVGEIGLSSGSWRVDEGETKLTFSSLWASIKKPFWRVFLLHFIPGILGFILAILIVGGVVLVSVLTLGVGLICMIPLFCVLGLVLFAGGILVSLMIRLMIPMMVNEDVSLVDSVKKAFELLKLNFWPLILMGLILFVLQMVLGLILAIPIIMVVFGGVAAGLIGSELTNFDPTILIPFALAFVCILVPVSMFISAVLQSYLGAAWTITYRRITGHEFGATTTAEVPELPELPEA
jgi:hypothetical protein